MIKAKLADTVLILSCTSGKIKQLFSATATRTNIERLIRRSNESVSEIKIVPQPSIHAPSQ